MNLSSSIPENHGLVQAGIALGRTTYGSPTLSDQSVLSCKSLKLGPGDTCGHIQPMNLYT
jgi:acetylornithine deacetylase